MKFDNYPKWLAVEIIDVFENYLDEKGIVIDNPEKEGVDDPANIFGDEYGNLETEVNKVLIRWKIITKEDLK